MNNIASERLQNPMAEHIRKAVENDLRSPRAGCDLYQQSLGQLLDSKNSILFNGSLFSEFSMYFFRALTLLLVRGDNIVFVCSSDEQSKWVQQYVNEGFSRLASLYCAGVPKDSEQTVNFDHPIWRIVRVEGNYNVEEAGVDECSILITTLDYLCSSDFKSEHKKFIHLIDSVIYVDILTELNRNREKMAMFNIALQNIAEVNAMRAKNGSINREYRVRYMSRPVRYICFDDTRTPGVDKALKNLLAVSFDTVDIMRYTGKTKISCYRMDGEKIYPKMLHTDEQIGLMMNMALFCLRNGAECVSVFPEDMIPYDDYWETISAHAGTLDMQLNKDRMRINQYSYDTEEYSVIFAADASRNLPAVLRKYASMTAEKPVLLYLLSPPYLFRDYYAERIDEIWQSTQFSRLPVEDVWDVKDVARNILLQAEAGGICAGEILRLFGSNPVLREYAKGKNVNTILREILGLYGISQKERVDLYRYFEYSPVRNFDKNGDYISDDRIGLRKEGVLYDAITGNRMAVLVVGEKRTPLPVPRKRLTQNYIIGQNLLCHGNVYHIDALDTINGEVCGHRVTGGKHEEAYRYVQVRRYYPDSSEESLEELFPQKKLILRKQNQDIEVDEITLSFLRVCTEVVTEGYYSLDPMTLDINSAKTVYVDLTDTGSDKIAKQTYRRYGQVQKPVYSSERILQSGTLNAGEYGARMMSIRMTGTFGEDLRRTVSLAAVMLNEILQSIFSYASDAIAVCPVLHTTFEEDSEILDKYPKLILSEDDVFFSKEDFELLIIEDCQEDLGVVNALYEAGEEVLHMLFDPVLIYLNWYAQSSEKSRYLYGGSEEEPACFDFESLHLLAKLLGTDNHLHGMMNTGGIKSKIRCDFCGKRCENPEDITEREDGRKMCKDCSSNLAENRPEVLNSCLEKAKQYLESAYGVSFDEKIEVILEPAEKIRHFLNQNGNERRGSDFSTLSYCEDLKIHVEDNIPAISLSEVLVRELTSLWQKKHTPELSEEMAEGHIALTGLQYLRFLNRNALAEMRTNYYESTEQSSGKGYRALLHELLNHPEYKNDPFLCVLAVCGIDESKILHRPARQIILDDYLLGRSYMPKSSDRSTDGNLTYFYYSRLSSEQRKAYDAIVEGIRSFSSSVAVNFSQSMYREDITTVLQTIKYDHPELYYFSMESFSSKEVFLKYVMSQSEVEAANQKIERAVQKYLDKIDSSMSAYDAALRLHIQLIENIDYDSIALKRQKLKGGPSMDEIDELRTIYGVFLNNTAVCEGYARAMQYLLQCCGIECAECAGYIKENNGDRGEPHAWNILKIDGDYYYLDTTWDDSSNTAQMVKNDSVGFDYFCITTEEMARSRDFQLCPIKDMPVCRAERANYYIHNNWYLRSYDRNNITEIAKEAARQNAPFFAFKCATKTVYNEALRHLLTEGNDVYDILSEAAKIDSSISDSRCTYQRDEKLFVLKVFFKKA